LIFDKVERIDETLNTQCKVHSAHGTVLLASGKDIAVLRKEVKALKYEMRKVGRLIRRMERHNSRRCIGDKDV